MSKLSNFYQYLSRYNPFRKKTKVLYVDFNPKHLDEFVEMFKDEDVEVETALSADEAVGLVERGSVYDFVVIDAKIREASRYDANERQFPCEDLADYLKERIPDLKSLVVNNSPIWGSNGLRVIECSSFVYMKDRFMFEFENGREN